MIIFNCSFLSYLTLFICYCFGPEIFTSKIKSIKLLLLEYERQPAKLVKCNFHLQRHDKGTVCFCSLIVNLFNRMNCTVKGIETQKTNERTGILTLQKAL